MQGVLDFSSILGERVFTTRDIDYDFKLVNSPYENRKDVERAIKQQLMPYSEQRLYDTHDNSYFWLGKCKSVSVKHEPVKRAFVVTITFTVYPFMFTLSSYFDDVWDSFDFDNGIAGFTKYKVSGKKEIVLINTSSTTVGPEVEVTSDMKVTTDGQTYLYKAGTSTNLSMGLRPGINKITVEGNGTIRFRWHAEVMG